MEFERRKIIGFREPGFSYHATGARVQQNSSTVMAVWKQWGLTSTDQLEKLVVTTEDDVSARRSTLTPHGGE
ncbi:hypothetical protein TNCV_2823081 [Trichonephila clavipes]|nr:hypothetical protein TNCV_2823081 [Trichonephila clavipes]